MTLATQRRDLRTGRSLWMARPAPTLPERALRRDVEAEVVIVGAGISGAMVAEQLTEAGLDVVLVDRRGPMLGATPASTALLQAEIDVPLSRLARRLGADRARRIWRRSKLALDALRERVRRLGLRADLASRDSLYLEGDVLDAAGLRQEYEARREAGFEVQLLEPREVKARWGIAGRAGLLGFDSLIADPRRLTAGLLQIACQRGARLYAPVAIEEVEAGPRRVLAHTAEGRTLRARHLIYATGYELPKGVPRLGHRVCSTWALATRPQPSRLWADECLIWEASDPYLYLRAGPKGEVICGGEDEAFGDEARRDALLEQKIATLQRKLARLMPWLDARADFAWCANFGASPTGTPSIGPIPGQPNCYALLGYGGNGITYAALAGQLLRSELCGRGDPDAELFSFTRKF